MGQGGGWLVPNDFKSQVRIGAVFSLETCVRRGGKKKEGGTGGDLSK